MEPKIAQMVEALRWDRLGFSAEPFKIEREALENVRSEVVVYVVVFGSPSLVRVWVMAKAWTEAGIDGG